MVMKCMILRLHLSVGVWESGLWDVVMKKASSLN